jgi:hypothetical protein
MLVVKWGNGLADLGEIAMAFSDLFIADKASTTAFGGQEM